MAPLDALSALGNIYDGSSDDESDDDEPVAAAAASASAPAATPAAAPVKEALPDAGDLLSDMPDEVDWSVRPGPVEEEAPGYDPVGTTYNNVPLPKTMAREQDAHNDVAHSKAGKGKGKPANRTLRQAPASSKADGALGASFGPAGRQPPPRKWPAAAFLRPTQPRTGRVTGKRAPLWTSRQRQEPPASAGAPRGQACAPFCPTQPAAYQTGADRRADRQRQAGRSRPRALDGTHYGLPLKNPQREPRPLTLHTCTFGSCRGGADVPNPKTLSLILPPILPLALILPN